METPLSIRSVIRPGHWATSIDLKDTYFHVLFHPRDRKWLLFVWQDRVLQFLALPFGLSLAPLVFTKVVRELVSLAHSRGLRLPRCYLDDWLVLADSQVQCATHTGLLLDRFRSLGFVPNLEKCDLTPSQSFDYLGLAFDTVEDLIRPSDARIYRLRRLLLALPSRESASARRLSSLLGFMEYLSYPWVGF